MLEKYLWFLSKCERPQVLDLGPVIGRNIEILSRYVSVLHVCDMVLRMGPALQQKPEPKLVLPYFDLRENSLDGVHLWGIPDHLDDKVLAVVVTRCAALLKPNGMIMFIAGNSPASQPFMQHLAIENDCTATLQKVTAQKLPYHYRANRDIEIMMRPLEQHSSFVCMNGTREFLFRVRPQ